MNPNKTNVNKPLPELYWHTIEYLESLGYFYEAGVWIQEGKVFGLIVSYSAISVGLMVYHPEAAESGYRIETGNLPTVRTIIQNLNFINEVTDKEITTIRL
ncbi:hypothetical protein ACQ4M3_13165 [Leptolyngbya sp. AN03gr2]|uniref:hypothetical protein n=1 Tax=unclassified Leptolyngbya TaxID=2650499 RepID=UPI003D3133E0